MYFGCSQNKNNPENGLTKADSVKAHQFLLENCYTCHDPNLPINQRLAPPMIAVKKHYQMGSSNKTEFVTKFSAFVNKPSEENAVMTEAVKKFGVMPNFGYSKEQVRLLAAYIYENEIESPSWFKEHFQSQQSNYETKIETDTSFIELGLKYALGTKAVLGKNLLTQIKNNGTEKALAFCNEQAFPLTDSMANEYNVSIKRVSDNERNPNNKANESELAYIKLIKQSHFDNQEMKPQLKNIDGIQTAYYPILTNKMCLQCHGDLEKDITKNTLNKINQLYPKDKATGYKENEIRGIWVVEMQNKDL
jgi:cytochrome c553